MSTHCSIGIRRSDGSETRVYCHFDGYVEYAGVILQLAYNTAEKVEALLALGDLSSIGYYPDRVPDGDEDSVSSTFCVAYHRDRGEAFRQSAGLEEYNYTFNEAEALWLVDEEVYVTGTVAMNTLEISGWSLTKSRLLLDAILGCASRLDSIEFWSSDDFAEAGGVTKACAARALEARREIIEGERALAEFYYRAYCD